MKRLVTGILAHVDSGKTTLSEAMLFNAGVIRKIGRVDHKDAFLDTDEIERRRGITIFSKQAIIKHRNTEFIILDTPGHVDFSAETERTLQVLDCAILVISATDGVSGHTRTLWKLLKSHGIPVFIFINKMDINGTDKSSILKILQGNLSESCVDFSDENMIEKLAETDERLLDEFLNTGNISLSTIEQSIAQRKVFPCLFGSALKNTGVCEFMDCLDKYTEQKIYEKEFRAKVYKISEDDKNNRLTFFKVTGGSINVKDVIALNDCSEKINELRIYNGTKYESISKAEAGMVCAATGLTKTYPGQGLGTEENSKKLTLEPVFSYKIDILGGEDAYKAYFKLKKLEEEETQLHIIWNAQHSEINIRLMGEVQLEVLKEIIFKRFDMQVEFSKGSIIYKETIADCVEGTGHYEPLRHYAEVHLLLEPLKSGSGLIFKSDCPEDELNRNWQRLILTHLAEKTHIGVLTGSPVTDMKITLIAGKAHLKHTEGGDFRQATYRALRQGLMKAKSVLLEPWYSFTIELPQENIGKAMNDIQLFGGKFSAPDINGDTAILKGSAPVRKMQDYQRDITAYTKGTGKLFCSLKGYEPCTDSEEIINSIGYNPEADLENTPDSVFCSHGAGFLVKWDEVEKYMHISGIENKNEETEVRQKRTSTHSTFIDEDELLEIFERTYGKIKRDIYRPFESPKKKELIYKPKPSKFDEKQYLLIDGYNIIFAWEDLKKVATDNLEYARQLLINRISNYRAVKQFEVIIVFDAYKVKGNPGSIENMYNITVVYTKEAETADAYIEKTTHELGKKHRVRVATSDNLEQMIILGNGAYRMTAGELLSEVVQTEKEIEEYLKGPVAKCTDHIKR